MSSRPSGERPTAVSVETLSIVYLYCYLLHTLLTSVYVFLRRPYHSVLFLGSKTTTKTYRNSGDVCRVRHIARLTNWPAPITGRSYKYSLNQTFSVPLDPFDRASWQTTTSSVKSITLRLISGHRMRTDNKEQSSEQTVSDRQIAINLQDFTSYPPSH